MTKEQGLTKITELVNRFDEQSTSYLRSEYNETLTRRDFIDPFFAALGWDMDNSSGYAEAYREVIHEHKIKIAKATKAPDYLFRLVGGKNLFFVEAKKPSVVVKEDSAPAYQVRRYGWTAKLDVSIISDFQEFAVYDCRKKPYLGDKASVARIKYLTYKDYIKEFDFLWDTFSREKVLKGSFDKFVATSNLKKGTTTVDSDFLDSLDRWRTLLATDICKSNVTINEEELNFSVQQIIDRLIFLRIAEDRGIEPYGRLQQTVTVGIYFQTMLDYFSEADAKYNSGLFDFKKDKITKTLTINNKVVKTIINELYYPECPYEFSFLSVEILGSAYEQFLGKQISIDSLHRVKIEQKEEVRKAGGVFYTPQYIVEYVVKQTLGKLLEGKKPKDISKIRIIDPSCGSGSFLIGAYDYLLKWHKDFYSNNGKIQRGKRGSHLTPEGNLSTAEKKRILLNNIYGVDLDVNAVEVTKLSLLLKCMEGETIASIATQFSLFNERLLPTMDNNIKSGNSLVDTDFYDTELEFDVEKTIKPFNWAKQFPDVFPEGFDIIVGNPPYGAELSKEVQKYCLAKYPVANTDTAALFMILAKRLLKSNGINGFIVPKAFTYASNWERTRNQLLDDIVIIVDCSKVWKEVKLEMTIYISVKDKKSRKFISAIRNANEIIEVGNIEKRLCRTFNFLINGVTEEEIDVALTMSQSNKKLNDVVNNRRGGMFQKHITTSGDYKVIGGKEVQRYHLSNRTERKVKKGYVHEAHAFIQDNAILAQNIVAHIQNPYPRIQIAATIISPTLAKNSVILDTVNQLTNKSSLSHNCILGILNSKIISWYTYKFVYANAIRTMHFDSTTTEKIPFPEIDLKNKDHKVIHDSIVKHVSSISYLFEEIHKATVPSQIEAIKSKISYLEEKINDGVGELFKLKAHQVKIIK